MKTTCFDQASNTAGVHVRTTGASPAPERALLRATIAAFCIGGAALASPVAMAANFSFTSGQSGTSFTDDSQARFTFNVQESSAVTLRTWSYAGGVNAAGQTIPPGGFDPVVSVFGSDGELIADNDDGSPNVDPVSGLSYDALLTLSLSPEQYSAVLTEYANFSEGTIDDFTGSGSNEIADGERTGSWALDILGVNSASFLGVDGGGGNPVRTPIAVAMQNIAVNGNAASTAAVISNACPKSPIGSRFRDDCTPVVIGALNPSGSTLQDQASFALSTVTVEQATVPLASSQASLSAQRQNLGTRLAALRSGATGISVRGLSWRNADPDLPGAAEQQIGGAASGDANPLFEGGGRLGVFVNGTTASANKDPTTNEEGFDSDAWSITAGIDYRFLDNLIAGLAIGYYSGSNDIDNSGGDLDTSGYSASLYGTWYQGESFFVDGMLTYGTNSYDQTRNINYQIGTTAVNQTAAADYDGDQWSAALGTGYMMAKGAWSYGPVARVEFVSANVDGYAEQMSDPNANGGGWAASVRDLHQDSLTSSLGFDVSRAVSTSWGVLVPQLHLDWTHEYRDNPLQVAGSFVQDPTNGVFGITGDAPDSDYFNGRLGVSVQFAGDNAAFLYYNKVFGYQNLDLDSFGLGVRMTF